MPESSTIGLNQLLDHPAVADAVADVNMELKERIAYQPPVCEVFKSPFTCLVPDTTYQFEIDKDAHRQLSHIIDNTVQRIEGSRNPDESAGANYRRARNIGIVFSGGPSPGGHNVIAGCSMRPNKSTPIHAYSVFSWDPTASSMVTIWN
jgi:pyrophosphate--fructose-6-phosphate 1-phosphotransferase